MTDAPSRAVMLFGTDFTERIDVGSIKLNDVS